MKRFINRIKALFAPKYYLRISNTVMLENNARYIDLRNKLLNS